MPDLVHDAGAVEQVRVVVATESRRVRALADPLAVPPPALGGLDAGGLGAALDRFCRALGGDLVAAADRLAGLDRALDVTGRSMHADDRRAAASMGRW